MRKRLFLFALMLSLLLSGCVLRAAETGNNELLVYRLDKSGGLVAESIRAVEGESSLQTLSRALNNAPHTEGLKNAFPSGVWIEGCTYNSGHARISMNEGYLALSGLDKTIANQTIACTLLRLDEVLTLDILQDGKAMVQNLTTDRVMLADAQSEGCEHMVKLFLPDFQEPGLFTETAVLNLDGTKEIWELAVQTLMERLDCLPEGTALRAISCTDGVCTLSLSQELYTTEPELAYNARLVIGSFVNTLCYLSEVDQVIICVGDTPLVSYGFFITTWPMSYDHNLLR